MAEKLKVTLVKSPISAIPKHRATVKALGLTQAAEDCRASEQRCSQGNDRSGITPGKSRGSHKLYFR